MREEDLICLKQRLIDIKELGWIENRRPGNSGGVGNTLEDLLDVAENNLQLPDFGAWELKSQRSETSSLLTLFHSEPKPRTARVVPRLLLPKYGWLHQEAGALYPITERSFRQTINAVNYTDRGFKVNVDRISCKIYIDFDFSRIHSRHSDWNSFVVDGVGKKDIDPNPYWEFEDIQKKLSKKIKNLMYVSANSKIENGIEYFTYNQIECYVDPTLDKFLNLIESGKIYVDFDARTGHNHGTKFRIKPAFKKELFQSHLEV